MAEVASQNEKNALEQPQTAPADDAQTKKQEVSSISASKEQNTPEQTHETGADVEAKAEAAPAESFSAFLSRLEKNSAADRVKAQLESEQQLKQELELAEKKEQDAARELVDLEKKAGQEAIEEIDRTESLVNRAIEHSRNSFDEYAARVSKHPRLAVEDVLKILAAAAAAAALLAVVFKALGRRR